MYTAFMLLIAMLPACRDTGIPLLKSAHVMC